MTFPVSRKGFDGEVRVNFDTLGKLYISIAIIWTTIVVGGSGFLLYNRHLPTLRVRNTYLWTAAVTFLHSYWVLCLIAYVLNGTYPCTAEFWIMSLWLPFAIALYQVNGMHLLHVASLQTRFIHPQALYAYRRSRSVKSGSRSLRDIGLPASLSRVQKICIAAGLVVQVLVSVVIYSISRKFHPSWGAIGHAVGPGQCRRDWEWVPSIVWQFFWAWIYAPYLLWKVRKIHDLHGWRLQTTISCIAGLLGTPMWLLALFTPGIVAMEVSVIFIPCIMAVKSRKLQKDTLQQILDWERNRDSRTSVDTGSTYVPIFDDFRLPSPVPSTSPIRSELYSMKALEKAVATNITPLLRFSALKDFSGENISFLKHVHDWKQSWTTASSSSPHQPPPSSLFHFSKKPQHDPSPLLEPTPLRHHQFAFALEIYLSFISPHYSDFPINLSSPQIKDLESIFSHAASTLDLDALVIHENTTTPFDSFPCPLLHHHHRVASEKDPDIEHHANSSTVVSPVRSREKDSISIASTAVNTAPCANPYSSNIPNTPTSHSGTTTHNPNRLNPIAPSPPSLLELKPRLSRQVAVPLDFGPHVFDEAERAVKYVVLTNTWPKFVGEGFASQKGGNTVRGKEGGVVLWGCGRR